MAVLLAAGSSRRWGLENKLLAARRGGPLLSRSLAIAGRAGPLVIVTGWQADRVARAARRLAPRARIVHAREHREGLGASLRAAARALRPTEREALLFLADMPDIDPRLAGRLVRAARRGDEVVRPVWRGLPGHPVLLHDARRRLLAAREDAGPARGLKVRTIAAGHGCVRDVDRPGRR